MFKQLFAILFFIFSPTIANAFEDKPLILDKSYVKLGYGFVHLPENNNVTQGNGDGAIDNTFPDAKYDFKYESIAFSAAD